MMQPGSKQIRSARLSAAFIRHRKSNLGPLLSYGKFEQRLPEPDRAVGDGKLRRHVEPAPLQLEQQIAPVLPLSRALSVKPTSSLRASGVAPISTRMHC